MKNTTKKTVSPAWQAKLDGKITVSDYNAIISKKMTLEDAIKSHQKPKKQAKKAEKPVSAEWKAYTDNKITLADYNNIVSGKISLGRLNKIKSCMKYYGKKFGIDIFGTELDTADSLEVTYNEFMAYGLNNNNGYAKWVANMLADAQQALYC